MKGVVDDSGRAIPPVEAPSTNHPKGVEVDVWIDTGFIGDLDFSVYIKATARLIIPYRLKRSC